MYEIESRNTGEVLLGCIHLRESHTFLGENDLLSMNLPVEVVDILYVSKEG